MDRGQFSEKDSGQFCVRLKIVSKCVTDTFDRLVLCFIAFFAQDKLKFENCRGRCLIVPKKK